jgi:signal transduction histidine kinase
VPLSPHLSARYTVIGRVTVLAVAAGFGLVSTEIAFGFINPRRWVPDLIVGLVLTGLGLYILPLARGTGWLLVSCGFAWWLGNFFPPLTYVHRGLMFHAVATFPESQPSSRVVSWIAIAYLGASLPAIASTEPGTAAYGAAVAAVAFNRFSGATGQKRRHHLFALYAAVALLMGTTGTALVRVVTDSRDFAEPTLLIYEMMLLAAATMYAIGVRIPAPETVADLVVDLGESRSPTVREAMSRLLGDPELEIGFDDGLGGYVDPQGAVVDLPTAGSGRVATVVGRETGGRAVIVHDASLETDRVLTEAVSIAAKLTASNARLNAQARARLANLAESRRRLLEAEMDERRSLALRLANRTESRLSSIEGTLRSLTSDEETPPSILKSAENALDQLRLTRQDLSSIARGLLPWGGDSNLAGALIALAERSPIPVVVDIKGEPSDHDLSSAIYYLCSEAVTNTLKHASADHIWIEINADGPALTVIVTDDGAGGADPRRGTGLQGLVDRVADVGGELSVESPPGGGTRLMGTFPDGGTR